MIKYADVFDTTKEMNDDIIFTVRYKSGSLGSVLRLPIHLHRKTVART